MRADEQFPVSKGVVLSLICDEGHELKGDKEVTCTRNTEFQFSEEPICGGQIYHWIIQFSQFSIEFKTQIHQNLSSLTSHF